MESEISMESKIRFKGMVLDEGDIEVVEWDKVGLIGRAIGDFTKDYGLELKALYLMG